MDAPMLLVTGAAGFIGSNLVDALTDGGHDVRGLVRRRGQVEALEATGAEAHLGDVTDPGSLGGAFAGVDVLVHLAAVIRPPDDYEPVNVAGTRNVVDAAHGAGVDRFVQMSVLGADPEADHPYYRSRGQAEAIVREAGLDATILRSSLVYGPGDHVVSLISELAQGPVTPVPGSGDVRMAPIHVDDLVAALVRIVEDPPSQRVLEVGGPDELTYEELVRNVVRRVNPRSRVQSVPTSLAKVGAWVMQMRGMETSPTEIDLLGAGDDLPRDNAIASLIDDEPEGVDAGLNYLGAVGPYGEPGSGVGDSL